MDEESCYMTVQQVAKWLNVTPQTVRKMIKDKRLLAMRIGDTGEGKTPRYRIPMVNVLEWARMQNENNS